MMIRSLNHYTDDSSEKMQRCHRYIHALEQERRKVLVFQRELPLCLEIVTQAIEACKRQLSGSTTENNLQGQSESSERTSAVPVLEEFIPIKKASSGSNVERDECKNPNSISHKDEGHCIKEKNNNNNPSKSDWLRSAQLWNQTPDPPHIRENSFENIHIKEVPARTGAFHPIQNEKINLNTQPLSASTSSTAENGRSENKINKKKEGKPSQRKTRRCWSPELHKRFLQALKQLGGSDAATPKQIRELMKVYGLTNDEVKSHLQKYRLHTKRPSSSVSNTTTNTPQTPQFVVVGGIWVPPEYSLVAKFGESPIPASNGILTSLPQNVKELSESPKTRGCSHSDSPVTSSPKHI